MAEKNSDLRDLEKTRLELEQNVSNLRASLSHWQQWEIEYEGMKEELSALGQTCTHKSLQYIGEDKDRSEISLNGSQSNLLNAKERKQLLYDVRGNLRNAQDVIDLLSRRIDYVERNVKTVTSLLRTAEEKLAASSGLAQPEIRNDEGLPLTEIHEELDEEGNVISSSVSHPEQRTPQFVEALRKAGVDGMPQDRLSRSSKSAMDGDSRSKVDTSPLDSSDVSSGPAKGRPTMPQKHVSFAEGTKSESDVDSPAHPNTLPEPMKEQMLQNTCVQIAEEAANDPEITEYRKILPIGSDKAKEYLATISKTGRRVNIAERVLKMPRNCDARRLLKHTQDGRHVKLRAAARLLSEMVETKDYQLDHYHLSNEGLSWRGSSAHPTNETYHVSFADETARNDCFKARRDALSNLRGDETISNMEYDRKLFETIQIHAETLLGSKPAPSGERYDDRSEPKYADLVVTPESRSNFDQETQRRIQAGASEVGTPAESSERLTLASQGPLLKESRTRPHVNGIASSPIQDRSDRGEDNPELCGTISSPVIPQDESPEDAALRRQMLQYNMNEVGAVVAEIDLDEDDDQSEGTYFGDDSEVDLEDSGDSDGEEDQYGRASSRVLTNDYLAEMQALERKLKAGRMVNVWLDPQALTATSGNVMRKPSEDKNFLNGATSKPKAPRSKAVRFAEELDVQKAFPLSGLDASGLARPALHPAGNPVIEGGVPTTTDSAANPRKEKPSRFKAATAEQTLDNGKPTRGEFDKSAVAPTAPKPPINATTIVERPYDPTAKASEPDDLDTILVNQQVKAEYHRLRNNMIYREGGFSKRYGERAEVPLDEEETGGRRVSRFKAARLGMRQV